jgi:hypothetical protein
LSSRPTPNPRRGILRAAITVVVLTALLIIAILAVSSLTAPSVKAPTAPLTPGPITPVTTPITTPVTATPGGTPRAVPSPTHKKKTLGSILEDRPSLQALESSPSDSMLGRAADWNTGGIAVRTRNHIAWYSRAVNSTLGMDLHFQVLPRGTTVNLGEADSLVRPVWSADGRYLQYVAQSRPSSSTGAGWTLLQYDTRRRTTARLATLVGFSMTPLGWRHARPLFLVANGSDTSVYTVEAGRVHFLDVLAPQPITSAALSPRAGEIAFVAPTNCYNCTLKLFDLQRRDAWSGPSGIANESLMAWSNDGRHVLTMIKGRIVVASSLAGAGAEFGGAAPLPQTWQHSLSVSIERGRVRVVDRITGRSIVANLQSGTF